METLIETGDLGENEKPEIKYLNASWFEAWMEGNTLLPQMHFAIVVFVMEVIFAEGQIEARSLDEITAYRMSPEQLRYAHDLMNKLHAAYFPKHKMIIPESSIDYLWQNIARDLQSVLISMGCFGYNIEQPIAMEDYRSFLTKASQLLRSESFRKIASKYRNSFRQGDKQANREVFVEIREKFKTMDCQISEEARGRIFDIIGVL
ncbi:hypothetical protein IT412_01540 [Candidatus Peregrinibacteria bacterium]|nr:hypothetical protein [Candidatus Peregrinibacteria bacterium]